jgi:biotin carboxylase
VHTREQALELIEETGYPVIAKPDDGVGALSTYRLGNEKDLDHFLATKPTRDYIVESFVAGKIISFDGLADREGHLLFYTAHAFSQGIMETVNENRHLFYYTLRDLPPALVSAGRRCIEAFKVRERFFHIEFFETAPDEYTALEVNMRPPGGYTTDMFNYAHDIDIYRIWAQLLTRDQNRIDYQRKYYCCYVSRKNHLTYVNSHQQIMERYASALLTVKRVPGVFSSALGDLGYLLRTPSYDEMMEIVSFIHQGKD